MVKLGAAMEMLLEKQALVFGAAEPSEGLLEPQFTPVQRDRLLNEYLTVKSQEPPTSYGTAMGVGGGIGAGIGGLAGAGGRGGAARVLLGAAIGGGIGALLGAGASAMDRSEIAQAKSDLGDPESAMMRRTMLARMMSDQRTDLRKERRHQQLIGAIDKRGSAFALLEKLSFRGKALSAIAKGPSAFGWKAPVKSAVSLPGKSVSVAERMAAVQKNMSAVAAKTKPPAMKLPQRGGFGIGGYRNFSNSLKNAQAASQRAA
ncbi:MAG TPA: hypothetical protein VM537_15520 [Anaerolineae bacterium]|nr:hypothetical protein [Anaerolineae bacterium]